MRIALFGPPGAGKGTQAALLINRYELAHVSTGNLIRAAIKEKTAVGVEALEYVSEGRLVPGLLVRKMAEDAIAAAGFSNFVLDGYPRTLEQASWLDEFLENNNAPLEWVLSLHVPDSLIIERLSRRRVHAETGEIYHLDYNPPPPDVPEHLLLHRSDDQAQAIQKRLFVYREMTLPLEEYFRRQQKLIEVDAVGSVEEVHGRLRRIIERREVDDRV